MSNDTISKDPRMQAEARRAASEVANEVNIPKAPYDPKAIAREEWERRIDPKYAERSFDETWETLSVPFKRPGKKEDFRVLLTEEEFRQCIGAVMRGVNSLNLRIAAEQEDEKAKAVQGAASVAIEDRVGKGPKLNECFPDLTTGYMRANVDFSNRKCFLHPNGCPDENGVVEIGGGGGLGQAIAAALANAIGARRK